MSAAPTVGIDFGTTTTLFAEGTPGSLPHVVPLGRTTPWVPSVAALTGSRLAVCEEALDLSPALLMKSVKRCITENRPDIASRDGRTVMPADDVITAILDELMRRARFERLSVTKGDTTRLGCPAMWTGSQRQRLLRLAENVGFAVGPSTLVDEPIAAGVHWAQRYTDGGAHLEDDRVLVFDMGGGTLDVALLDITGGPGSEPNIFVLASDGVNRAGDALDEALAELLETKLAEKGLVVDDLDDPSTLRAYLLRAAEQAKTSLSSTTSTIVHIPYQAIDVPDLSLTVEELADTFTEQLRGTTDLIYSVLRTAQLTRDHRESSSKRSPDPASLRRIPESELGAKVGHVLLVGGMSRVPAIARFLQGLFPTARFHDMPGDLAQGAIAAGLANNSPYERVNLHRPAFDFVLSYEGQNGRTEHLTMYRAHTPFYAPWEAHSSAQLAYRWPEGATARESAINRSLPRRGTARLTSVALDGTPVVFRLSGADRTRQEEHPWVKVELGHLTPRLVIRPNGWITIVNGQGESETFRAPNWPALSNGYAKVVLPVEREPNMPMIRAWWDTK